MADEESAKVFAVAAFFSPEECDRVIALADLAPVLEGNVGTVPRASQVRFLVPSKESAWVFQKLEKAISDANKTFRYPLTGIEPVQVARYPEGCYYGWHADGIPGGPNSARKLSLSVQLSDPEDYAGGSLEFKDTPTEDITGRGTLIVFPSFMVHRVSAVTRGVRQSLVAWVIGKDSPPQGS